MPLKLILKPGEKVIINQAVIVNGAEKAEVILQNKATVLRQRDIMTEEKADTPAKRIYFTIQMMYLFPEHHRFYQNNFTALAQEFVSAAPGSTGLVLDIGQQVLGGEFYSALRMCRKLIKYEEEVMRHVSERKRSLSQDSEPGRLAPADRGPGSDGSGASPGGGPAEH